MNSLVPNWIGITDMRLGVHVHSTLVYALANQIFLKKFFFRSFSNFLFFFQKYTSFSPKGDKKYRLLIFFRSLKCEKKTFLRKFQGAACHEIICISYSMYQLQIGKSLEQDFQLKRHVTIQRANTRGLVMFLCVKSLAWQ